MLIASVLAGRLWSRHGLPATFHAGAAFTLVALGGLAVVRGPGVADPILRAKDPVGSRIDVAIACVPA